MKDLKFICEKWRDIKQFEGYEVSNLGRVRGKDRLVKRKTGYCFIKGRELKQVFNKKGYPEVRFRKKGSHTRSVHRLVADAFILNCNNKLQVNHIDGNKLNNRIDNLEWVSNSENQLHAYRLGLQPSRAGEKNNKAKITDSQVTQIKLSYNLGKSIFEVSKETGISLGIIRDIIYLRTWKSNKTSILKRDDRSKTKKPILCEN
jgi:predicted RNA binding protein YcfA (HicA-like mRNA interferase family)